MPCTIIFETKFALWVLL